jgi:colanic acid/amylovoran biosynthesis glycosyltransferase
VKIAVIVVAFPTISETFLFNKVVRLRQRGLDVTVVTHKDSHREDFFSDLSPSDYSFRRQALISLPKHRLPAALLREIRSAGGAGRRLMRNAFARYPRGRALRAWLMGLPLASGGFDIVHFEFSGLGVNYLDVLPLLECKSLVSCRGAAEQITPLVDKQRASRLRDVFQQVDAIHCVSQDMLSTIQGYGADPRKAFVNYPSIDLAAFDAVDRVAGDDSPSQILSVGRLHWKKGYEFALLAMHEVVAAGFDVIYNIVGAGDQEESLRVAVRDLGLEQRVRFLGAKPHYEVKALLGASDIFLLPSVSEGLSNAALEAMAMRVPVISTTAGGMSEAIRDGIDGLTVPPRDAKAMARSIIRLLDSPEQRSRLGKAGRERVATAFTLDRQIDVFLDVYSALKDGRSWSPLERKHEDAG